uniref:Nucleoside-diphosphate kinase n=1 Tax=Eutreptiella gymnastica TaxID=73025 RepID=A0A7S4G7Y2_9EUGL
MAQPIYVINGFYMAMREKYTGPGASISYMLVEWDSAKLSWEDFRGKVLGATDPSAAAAGSLRRQIFEQWRALGLKSEPNVGDNGVHASASPFEALAERMNWVGAKLSSDEFGKAMLAAGISGETLMNWTKDPQVEFAGKKQSLFDLLEDLDCKRCIEKACAIAGVKAPEVKPTKNQAFVFVKPHAVAPATMELVKKGFAAAGISIVSGGSLDNKTIEKKLLIDNHYYAIANKASLSKPKDLNPPAAKQQEFAKMFGITWADALAQGVVYNAVDGCTKLGIDGGEMDKRWAAAKDAGKLVKFGGGFYAGLVTPPAASAPASSATFFHQLLQLMTGLCECGGWVAPNTGR